MVGREVAALVLVGAIVAGMAPGAAAQEVQPPVLTLRANANEVVWDTKVRLSGTLSTGEEGAEIDIFDETGALVAEAVTDEDGAYRTSFAAIENVDLVAQWGEVRSETEAVRVKPIVKVNLYRVRLFGKATVTGNVLPATPRGRVTLKLRRYGKVVAEKTARIRNSRHYRAHFAIRKPGTYTVRASFAPDDMRRSGATSRGLGTALPSLSLGQRGGFVKLLEGRLRGLGYYLPRADRRFDEKTRDALLAFAKVQRIARRAKVDAGTWRLLASPIKPRPRVKDAFHIEIDQTRQVIFVVKNLKVRWIVHTSTGKASTPTRDGVFRIYSKVAGYSPRRLYYPSFFDGGRAIHGWPEVPTYPASHGCARVPMWAAQWIYGVATMGTTVRVYH